MQANTYIHEHITGSILPQPNRVFHDPTALDATDDVFNPHASMCNERVFVLLLLPQLLAAWLFMRHCDLDTIEPKAKEAQILQ